MSVPSKVMRPPLRLCSPQIALKQVVLPAPLGPMRPVTMPGVDVEVHAAQRVHAPESNLGFRYLQKRHRLPPHCGRAGRSGPLGPGA